MSWSQGKGRPDSYPLLNSTPLLSTGFADAWIIMQKEVDCNVTYRFTNLFQHSKYFTRKNWIPGKDFNWPNVIMKICNR